MITAHLPSGYILAHALPAAPFVFPAAILGAILPDFDLIWFYFIDNRAIHHHRYWVHAPGFWLMLAAVGIPLIRQFAARFLPAALAFLTAILLHIVLDTLAGSIMWLWPFSNELYVLIDVPATQSHWILSFLLHWTMLAELLIWIVAFILFFRRPSVRT